ncbi:UNVERIFIED_CONTAM: hypothetical protein FKN15_069372 [Acipenser sinensis]
MAVWGSLLSVLLVLLMSTRSQGLLSDFKKCGDAECESLISRVQAIRDHKGPDCRFLNFKSGAVIFVYYKLAGQRDDLWAGSIDKQFGYFPRDAVEIEEVYVSNEVQIPAKETDFFCLDGSGYFTESESSHLESQEPHKPEVPASEQNENVDSGKGEPGDSAEQLGQVNKDLKVAEQEGSRWLGSRVTGWLGLGSQEDDGEQKKAEQLSFKSRKIAMDFNDNAFKSDIDKETEPKETGWLSGSLSNLMNFRGQAPEVLANNKPENADDKITAQHRKKETMTNTGEAGETEIEHNSQEEKAASDGSKSNWLNIGISDVLSFSRNSWNGNSKPKDGTLKEKYDGQVEDDKISSDGEQELNREETSTQIGEQRSIVPNTEKKDSTSHPDKETVEGETNMKGGKTGWYDNVSNNTLGFVREEMSGQREVHFLKDAESTEMALDIQEPDLGEEVKVSAEITDNREEEESQFMLSVGGIQNMYGSLKSRFQQDNSDTKKDLPKEEASVESTEHKKLTESDQDVLDNMHPMENLQEQSMSDSVQVAGLNEMEEMLEGDQGGENEIGIPTANKPGPEHRAELDFPFGTNVGNNVQFLEELGVVKEGTGNHQDVFISDSEDPIKLTGNSNHFSKESDLPKDNDNDIEKEAEHEQIERTIPEHTTKNTILNLSEGSVVGKPSTKSHNYHLNDAGLNKDVFESDTEKHNALQDKEHAETTVNHNLKETIHSPSESTLFNKESDPLSATDFTKQLQNEYDNQDQLHLVSKQEHYNYANLPGDTAIDGGILEATDTTSSLTLKELTSILVQEEGLIKMNLSIKEGFQSQDQPSIEAQAKLKEDNKKVRKPENAEEIMKIQHKMLNEEKLSCRESLAHADKSLNHLSIKDMSNEYLPQTHDSKVVPPEEKKHNVKDKDQGIFETTTKHLPELQSLEKSTLDTKDHYESINSDNAQMTPVTQDMLLESSLKPEKTIVIDTDEVILHETSTDHRDGDNDKHSLDSKGLKLDADSEDSSRSSQELVLLAQKLITEQGISPVIESEALSPEQTDTKAHESQPFSQQQTKIIKSESVSAPNQETSVWHVSEESPYVPEEFNRVEERLLLEMKNEQPGTLNFEQNLRTEAKQANGKLASDSPLVEHSSSTESPLGAVLDKSIYTDKTNTESIKGIAGLHPDLIKKENVVQDLHKLPKTNDIHSETSIGKIENKLTNEKEVQNKLDSLTFKEGVDKTQNNLEAKCGEEDNPIVDKKDSGQVEKESGINHVELNSGESEYSNSMRGKGSLGLPYDHSTKSTFSLVGEEETSKSSTQTADSLQETKHQDQIHTPVPKATKAFKDLRRMRKYMTAEDIEYLIHAFGYRKLLWLDYSLDNTEAELSSQNDEDILTLISDFEHGLKHYQRITAAAKKSSIQENIKGDRLQDNNMALQKLEGLLSTLKSRCTAKTSVRTEDQGREKKLATKVAELLEEKCKVLETLSECKQQYEKLDATLKNCGHSKQASEKENLQVMSMKLENSNSELKEEIDQLKQDLDSQITTRAQQDELLAEMQRSLKSLEEEAIGLKSQMEQLVQEAEGWDERLNELAEQIKMCEESQKDMQEDCSNKDEQIKLHAGLKSIEEDKNRICTKLADEEKAKEDLKDHQKEQIQNLIYAVKLHAGLKSIEEDKNRIFTKLADEEKAKEDLKERIEKLKNDKDVLQSESMKYTSEAQKLQQKLKIMTEMYQENELKLHRKLTVEEKERMQKEEKLTKADEKIILAAEELSSYRQRAKDLEEERERTNQAYKNQIASHEKKAHDNWLAARAAERDLNEIKRENSHLRQRLTDSQFKLEMVEKDPYVLDVPGRPQFRGERSPFGPSPLGRPASETRAFLSPPTLMDGPPRVSPAFPGVPGGRASRGPPNHAAHPVLSESLDPNCDRNFDNYSTHSDSGSLSPTWERERRVHVPPPGYPYPDPTFPYRRPPPERGYPMPPPSGRLSGPAEIRGYSPLSADGSYLVNSLDNSGAAGNENKDLTVEEKERTQKEEKLTKADEKIILAAEELSSYRQRAKDLEEERERTNQAYKNQIASHEKKAHDNWLAARAAERDLNEIKRENSHLRQRLTDSQFKLEMVEKDPYALDVPGRPQFRGERSPFGPSPLGRPASETRAFLSPPTLMDGPPRVSPAFPGVPGGRGYPYPDPTFPYRRPPPERGYPMPPPSGRLSGPAEIRGYSPLSAVRGPPPPGMFPRFPPPQLHPGYPPARYPTESASGPPPRPPPPTSEQLGEHAAPPPPQDII